MKRAIKEATTDTLIGFAINVPLNFILISLAFSLQYNEIQTTVLLTVVFTLLAIIRKTVVRLYFAKNDNEGANDGQKKNQ